MAYTQQRGLRLVSQLNNINADDLQNVEKDLCFYEMVSLGFLLFGDERANAEFVLQKLLVLSNNNLKLAGCGGADLLRKYISVNPRNWRACIVEALAIINARRVLRKLGFNWEELHQQYLPHIGELSLHVHPLLKALYRVCERLKPTQAGQLVLRVNEQHKRPEDLLRFYDFSYLEIFFLDWISRRIISVGDSVANGANVEVLLEYFKFNDMDMLKKLLIETINNNADRVMRTDASSASETISMNSSAANVGAIIADNINCAPKRIFELSSNECYTVRQEAAGIVLIINQMDFHEEPDKELKHLLPKKKLEQRRGTDVDREELKKVFVDFGYNPREFDNLTHNELKHHIRETVKLSFQYDSLVVCILSHGIDGAVYGCNSIPVEIIEIEQIISDDTMQGKPKMLIIQACQKDPAPQNADTKPKITNATPDKLGDMVKAMSTVSGFPSMRHTVEGTWFIQSLCKAIRELGDSKHILDILIHVNREVSERRGDKNEAMVTHTSNTLRKYFFLPSRNKVNTICTGDKL